MKLLDIIFVGFVDLNELKKLTKKEFIQQATKKWKGKYTYDNVNYVNQKTKVLITFPLHGDFPQLPVDHLRGYEGCKNCYSKSKLQYILIGIFIGLAISYLLRRNNKDKNLKKSNK